MTDVAPDRLLDALSDLAVMAGAAILDIYARPIEVHSKSDSSPVTAADEAAEAIILEGLAAIAPDIPVVAEESFAAGRVPAIGHRFFLVDPLDGTKEFISRNGEFTVNIALIENGAPVAGVVYAPALGRLFSGGPAGAFSARVESGRTVERCRTGVRPVPAGGLTVVASRSHGTDATDAFIRRFPVSDYRSAGSSLKFCLLACGEADLYPRLGRTMEWDTAAGDAVLRAAGGVVRRLDGAPLTYGKRSQPDDTDFANPHFVAASHASLVG